MFSKDAIWGAKDSHMVRPWHCPTSMTEKQPPGLAAESRCTASCAPYEMPEEILEWSGTRNVIRPLSAYGTSTRRTRRMVSQHWTVKEGMCTAQITILLRGSSRNNQNEGREDAQQIWETATAKAENKVHEGWQVQPGKDRPQGLYAHHETPERAPWGHPLGGVIPKEYCRNSVMHSIRPEKTILIQHWVLRVRQRWKSEMTSSHTTLRHPDIPWWPTKSAV